jgi:hypothetical protein
MDESGITQNRRSSRSPVLLSAKVDVGGREVPVILRNLSSKGALIESAELPAEGAITSFHRNELRVTGRVAWVEGRYAGLTFDRELDRAELLRQVPSPRQRFERQFRRPGFTCGSLTEAERQMIGMWSTPLQPRD